MDPILCICALRLSRGLLGSKQQARLFRQRSRLVRRFPGEFRFASAEVAVSGRLPIDGAAEIEALDNALGRKREVLADELSKLGLSDFAGAECVNADADRLSHADGIGELDFSAISQAGSNDVLGDVSGHISRGTIDLGRILTGKGASAVTARAAVAVHDDLAASEPGVAHRSADNKTACRIDVVLGVLVKPRSRKDCLDDVFEDVGMQFLITDTFGMLAGDNNCIDAGRLPILVVLDGDLALAVRA